jgi:D-alanyl-D-alanine dipeptidase
MHQDFVDIEKINPRILLDIRYATDNNFLGRAVYSIPKCFLRKEVAEKLDLVQKFLEKKGLGIKVYDGYRPLSVQKEFWNFLPDDRYVANPAIGSRHNRGAAVDLTLVDKQGNELTMPTPFDDFTEKAHRTCKDLSQEELNNSLLLEEVMLQFGFTSFQTEWWHFDFKGWEKFPVLDISLEEFDQCLN